MHRWIDHESELELSIEDESPEAVMAEALRALGEILDDERRGVHASDEVAVSVTAPDRAALLAEWLGELAYLAEADGFVADRVVRMDLADTVLDATVAGRRFAARNPIKAVTYHRLEMREDDGKWRARVILDV